jgi:hypothetical protein
MELLMAARARHSGSPPSALTERSTPVAAGQPAPATGAEMAVPPPTHRLQELLEARVLAEGRFVEPSEPRWPPLATLAFVVATCGSFWAAVIFAATHLL